MPRKKHPKRTLSELFELSRNIGVENVFLTDAELGSVLVGDDEHGLCAGSVYNQRYVGKLTTPVVRTTREPRTRLSDALAFTAKKTRCAA